VLDPRGVLADFGTVLDDDVAIRVHDSTSELRYLVVPQRPAGTDGWSADELAAIVSRDAMIGTRLVSA
jgi:nitrile hydratase